MQVITNKHKHKSYEVLHREQSQILNIFKIHRETITIGVAITSTILILGFLLSNIPSPNASLGSMFDSLPVFKNGLGAVNGYAFSSSGLPAVGTIIIAAGQSGSAKTVSVDMTSEGKYVFPDLYPGKYNIVAYFPDGEYRVLNNIEVVPNSVQTLIFKY